MQPRDIWHAKIPSKKGWCNYSIISDFFKGNNEWLGFQVALVIKNLPVKVGDTRDVGSIPGSGRSPEVRSGNLLQYSCLKNSRQKSLKGYSLQLLLSCVWLFVSPWISAHQASLSITNSQSSLRFTSIESVMPSIHLVIWCPLLLPPIPPSISLFQWVNSSQEVAKGLEFQLQHHSLQRNPRADLLQNGLVGSPCSPRDSQESSPILQFKSINSLVLSLLHSPTLTSIHDHRKNHSLD